jgi:hypothetical protein
MSTTPRAGSFDATGRSGAAYQVGGVTVITDTRNGSFVNLTATGTVTLPTDSVGWAAVSKTGSSLADLVTRSAADLSSGTLPSARLAGQYTGITRVGTLDQLTMSGDINLVGNQLQQASFWVYNEFVFQSAISSGTLQISLNASNVFRCARNANITTVQFLNPPTTGWAYSFTLIFDANGTAHTVTWPASVKWPGGTAPTLTSTNGRSDILTFYTQNAGATWYAMVAALDVVTT